MNGKIAIDRSIMSWEWWDDLYTSKVWLTILLLANWRETKWHGQVIPRGSFVTSYSNLSAASGVSIRRVRTALSRLELTGEISRKTTNKFQLITVEKYEFYQDINTVTDNQLTNKRQTTDNQLTINRQQLNKGNKGNKGNKDIYTPEISSSIENIVGYLNSKLGTNYKPKSKETSSLISARLKEGFTEDDFRRVIDGRISAWGDDPKMSQYLRPSTLFRPSKFEEYLNAPDTKRQKNEKKQTRLKEQLEENEKRLAEIRNTYAEADISERMRIKLNMAWLEDECDRLRGLIEKEMQQ